MVNNTISFSFRTGNKITREPVRCWACGQRGHRKRDCEEGGGKTRGEGGEKGGKERKWEQNDCEYGRGRVGVYF